MILVNNLRKYVEHTEHKEELARNTNINIIYKCLCTKKNFIQPTKAEFKVISS